ncbi:MAG: hypothetical protein WCJ17_04400, partial [bacterium]
MQKNILIIMALLTSHGVLQATIHFGSRDAGFVVDAGVLGLGSASLSEGTVVVNVDNGVTSSGMSCSHMKFDLPNSLSRSVVELNGHIAFGTNITLTAGEKLTLDGGTLYESVSVFSDESAPAIIEGLGSFDQNILVSSPCTLAMRWDGPLNVDIDLQSSSGISQLVLERDLLFAPHHGVRSSYGDDPLVTCNGYTVSMGGDGMLDTWLTSNLSWQAAHIDLTGPFTLDSAVYAFTTGAAVINGNGNRWAFTNNAQLYANGVTVYCNNIVFAGVNSVTFYSDTVDDSGAFSFRDVTLGSYTEDGVLRSLDVTGDLVSEESDIFDGY